MSEFIESIQMWINNLSVNSIIIFIMMIFMLIGAVDRIQGNRWGYGQKFEEGFHAIGPMMLAMAGGNCGGTSLSNSAKTNCCTYLSTDRS